MSTHDLVDGRDVLGLASEEVLEMLDPKVAVWGARQRNQRPFESEKVTISRKLTHLTPMDRTLPESFARQQPSHIAARTSGPPFGSWIKYRSM